MPDVLLTFSELSAGDVVGDQFGSSGVTISSGTHGKPPMVFDTNNPTGGDYDLATSNLGNVLIISEDGDSHDPDDNWNGGSLIFDFDEPSEVVNFRILDIEEGGTVRLWNEEGHLIKTVHLPHTGNNGQAMVQINQSDVARMEVTLNGSGALDDICFRTPEPMGNGIVEGTEGDDDMVIGYVDADGDTIDGADGLDDTIEGFGGNDNIVSGDGNDVVYGGSGNDVIDTSGSDSEGLNAAPDQGLDIPFPYDEIVPDIHPDADPNNDMDTVFGGTGSDSITTGDDRDTVEGGGGHDTIDSGIDDDSVDGGNGDDVIYAGHGADIVRGGDGDDIINSGEDFLSDYANDTIGIPFADPNPNDDKDTVFGGKGNDTISTGDDADVIYGGADNDSIDGGIDDDYIEGGSGNDKIEGGHGSDEIYGGDGDDIIDAAESVTPPGGIGEVPDAVDPEPGNGIDLVYGGAGNDVIFGGDDDDVLYGDEGSDYLEGGLDEDELYGGANDDVILVGHGDEAYGGAGDDYFSVDPDTGNLGDISIYGGETDENDGDATKSGGDTLDLSNLYADGAIEEGSLVITDPDPSTPGGGQTGFVYLKDGTRIDFEGIEEFVCFTAGTMILTAKGEKPVETLQVGDKIVTKDHGLQEMRWIGSRKVLATGKMAPIMIKAGAMGNDRDLRVSPQHRMLIEGWKSEMLFGEPEVLAAAKHLANGDNIYTAKGGEVEYFHMLFDTHEIVYANGAASESFHPGEEGFGALAEEAREEVLTIFPELRRDVAAYGAAARTSLKGHEAKVLADNPDFLK